MRGKHWFDVLHLAFQYIRFVFGDLGTSPLYVLASTFSNGIQDPDDILGVLSVIIYSILTITVGKYTFMVLSANNNEDDYSLMMRLINIVLCELNQDLFRDADHFSSHLGLELT
uniref:K+ potassium transporter integral membrane domain-containing protein n=1 Tax=Populus trichocarpa TaxID=3694 RepID=U7E057_POPTR